MSLEPLWLKKKVGVIVLELGIELNGGHINTNSANDTTSSPGCAMC